MQIREAFHIFSISSVPSLITLTNKCYFLSKKIKEESKIRMKFIIRGRVKEAGETLVKKRDDFFLNPLFLSF